jgi:large subunit ribosomal protein L28
MSNRCSILKDKKPRTGHSVSHSNIKTKRRFLVNSHIVSFYSEALKKTFKLNVSTTFLRTVAKTGGFDKYFASTSAKANKLSIEGMKIRKAIRNKIGTSFVKSEKINVEVA